MFTLGFNEFLRNFKKNILVIIQLIIVYIVSIFVISAFDEQYRLFGGMSNVFDDTGIIISKRALLYDKSIAEESFNSVLTDVKNIEHGYYWKLLDTNDNYPEIRNFSISISSNNPEHITYVPNLIEGEWCEDAPHEDGVINAVASNNFPFDISVGDKIELSGLCFKITGIVSTKEMIYGINNSINSLEISHLTFYNSIRDKDPYQPSFIVSYEDWINNATDYTGYNIYWNPLVVIDLDDNLTQEQIRDIMEKIINKFDYQLGAEIWSTKNAYDYSWQLLEIKLMPMFSLLLVVVVVLIISLIISAAINILYEKKNYGIYFICGNNWKGTFKFSTVSWTIVAITSLIIAICACLLIESSGYFTGLALSFSWIHVIGLLGITILFLIIAALIPYLMIRKIQPVSILKENHK